MFHRPEIYFVRPKMTDHYNLISQTKLSFPLKISLNDQNEFSRPEIQSNMQTLVP